MQITHDDAFALLSGCLQRPKRPQFRTRFSAPLSGLRSVAGRSGSPSRKSGKRDQRRSRLSGQGLGGEAMGRWGGGTSVEGGPAALHVAVGAPQELVVLVQGQTAVAPRRRRGDTVVQRRSPTIHGLLLINDVIPSQ